ncbi:hypothetical protein BD309DRAFT_834447, partial [Dichomitus squalens]
MPATISADLKERIVYLYLGENWTMCQISETLKVSTGLVSKVVALYRTYGTVIDPTKQRTGRPRAVNGDATLYLTEILRANPNMYLDKIQARLL